MAEGKRTDFVGVRVTTEENEALRQVAFKEKTTKSSLLRQLFVDRYLDAADKRGKQNRQEPR